METLSIIFLSLAILFLIILIFLFFRLHKTETQFRESENEKQNFIKEVERLTTLLTTFIQWTVWTRIAVIFYFVAFVFVVDAPKQLLLFGSIDLLAAIWTWLALKKG